MDITGLISMIVEMGLTPGLLVIFIIFFFKQDKRRDEQYDKIRENFKSQMDGILAESIRREEKMRIESEKREQIMRQESERREVMITRSIDGLNNTMAKMSDCMSDMKEAFIQMDMRLQNVESKVTERVRVYE